MISYNLCLQAMTEHCFEGLIAIKSTQFQLYMDSIVWGIKHSMRNVAEISLDMLRCLLERMIVADNQATTQLFYKQYLVGTFEHVLAVVSDSSQAQVGVMTADPVLFFLLCRWPVLPTMPRSSALCAASSSRPSICRCR
jgi:hypothetical protein